MVNKYHQVAVNSCKSIPLDAGVLHEYWQNLFTCTPIFFVLNAVFTTVMA